MTTILLAPLDPVHDNAVKLLKRKLIDLGYDAECMPPGVSPEEIVDTALKLRPAAILVSRTLGYQVGETLGRLVDLVEAAGLREKTRLGIGGMAITREVGAELGFDGVFVGDLDMAALTAFLEGRAAGVDLQALKAVRREKPDLTRGYTYEFKDKHIEALLDQITSQMLEWCEGKTSPGVERMRIRREALAAGITFSGPGSTNQAELAQRYISLCDAKIQAAYCDGKLPEGVRRLDQAEIDGLPAALPEDARKFGTIRHVGERPYLFIQYGTGCPIMDIVHIKTGEGWGADGVIHFDPSWGALTEGLLEGLLSHAHDGTILTLDNLRLIRSHMDAATSWNVRGHRGLNTPEMQVLAQAAGADLLKINIPYGGTAGGTDPARLIVDGTESVRLAAEFGLPFDIPGNDELSGVPPEKTFAGLLIMMMLGLKLGARPIPKPLLCYSPYMTITGEMDDNMVDMNLAKLAVWQEILDTPVWPGEPVGFMTHTPERVQSAMATAAHVALAKAAGVTAVTFASSDEAYSKGPISAHARVDTIRAVHELLRFLGSAGFQPTPAEPGMREKLHAGIVKTLETVANRGDFAAALYEGLLGNPEDGLYPGRAGRGSVKGYTPPVY